MNKSEALNRIKNADLNEKKKKKNSRQKWNKFLKKLFIMEISNKMPEAVT